MSHLSPSLASIIACTLGCWMLAGCGGASTGGDDGSPGASGSAGSSGRGGGQAGSAGRGGSGSGSGGSAGGSGGTGVGGGSCEYDGQTYANGESFPAGDGCNTCSCEQGQVGCTLVYCDQCSDISSAFAGAIDQAKTCDPALTGQCTKLVVAGLLCGCESFVNADQVDAITQAAAARDEYAALSCGGDVLCEPCLPPSSAYCSSEGRCVDVYETGAAGCEVEGTVYPSGSTNVPDPFSCNTCTCADGQLACTDIACPEDCPPDSVPSTQCTQCGPADGCEVVEHACLPVCTDACENGLCVDGVCRASFCG